MARDLYEFGPFRLDPVGRRLFRDGQPVALTPKAFDALVVLVENHGTRLSREELVRRIWPDTTVGEDNLKQCVAVLRSTLEDNSRQPSYVATLPGYGYSFVAEVRQVADPVAADLLSDAGNGSGRNNSGNRFLKNAPVQVPIEPAISGPRISRRWTVVAAVVLVLVATLFLARASVRRRLLRQREVRTIAVLPFQPPTPQPEDEYLGIGLTDAVITKLAKARNLRVRTLDEVSSYSGKNSDPIKASRELAVGALLTGTIQRQGEQVRIRVRLLDTASGNDLWSDEIAASVEDMFVLEDKVVAEVESTLSAQPRTSGNTSSTPSSTDARAREDYMKGRFFWSKRTKDGFTTAIQFFQQAIERDPKYAEAYAGTADSYALLGFYGYLAPVESYPKAKQAALEALALNRDLPDPHVSLLIVATDYEWDWETAEKEFRAAVELNPNSAEAYQAHGYLLLALARSDAAEREVQKALELDPVSPAINVTLAWVHYLGHDYKRCLQQCRRTLELFPDFVVAIQVSAAALAQQGEWQEAEQEITRAARLSPDNPITSLVQAEVLAAGERSEGTAKNRENDNGRRVQNRAQLEQILRKHQANISLAYYLAAAYASLGQKDEAFAALDQALAARSNWLIYLKLDPRFESLHDDARFAALLKKVGLDTKP
jgi:TolB-like protein/DNA-binding winged helix-turn-helix (wHTH) protein/tetratricopeptide (TPR) repeat protein